MSLSVTATSSTLFVSGIPADATSLTFAVSADGTTYTNFTVANIQTNTLSYSLTTQTVASYYYRVTPSVGGTPGTAASAQYASSTRGPTPQNWRLNILNVNGTSLTSSSSPVLTNLTYGTYYYITNSGFNALTLPAPVATDIGAFWVLRNNTSAYLSISVTNPNGLPSPLVIPPSNSATIISTGSAYILF